MKILMLVDSLNFGGTETHVIELCKSLHEIGVKTLILSLSNYNSSYSIKQRVCVKFIDSNSKFAILDDFLNIIRYQNINIIHCHGIESMKFISGFYNVIRIPYIVTIHGLYYSKYDILKMSENAYHIIAVSIPVEKFIIETIGLDNIYKVPLIYNSVKLLKNIDTLNNYNLKSKLNIPYESKVITYCSRFSFSKGKLAENFIHEVESLLEDNIYILLIGDGVLKRNIDFYSNRINSKLKIQKMITIGFVQNINAYYSISDIVIGTGRVTVESLNMGKPVICYGIKGYLGIFNPLNSDAILDTYFGDHGYNTNINKLNISISI